MSIIVSKVIYKNDILTPYSNLEDRVETIITNEEIDKMF